MSASIDIYVNSFLTGMPTYTANAYGGTLVGTGTQGTVTKKLSNPWFEASGVRVHKALAVWTKGTESDGTIYRLWKGLPGNLIPLSLWICGAAIAGLSSVKLGLLQSGQVIPGGPIGTPVTAAGSDAVFATGLNISAGAVNFNEATAFDGLTAVHDTAAHSIAARSTRLFEFAGDNITNRGPALFYDLAMTCTTAGTNTGLLAAELTFVLG